MLIPVRCFTCNSSVGHLWEPYLRYKGREEEDGDFDAFCRAHGLRRYCCRTMLLTHVDVGAQIATYRFADQTRGTTSIRCIATRERTVSCD